MFRFSTITIALALLTALGGCQSAPATGTGENAVAEPGEKALACAKCETTWVNVPIRGKAHRIIAYSPRKQMHCPDCVSAAENFFKTGRLEHACATCGPDAMKVCNAH